MKTFVLDASVTLPWCFEDEATPWTEGLLDHLRSGDRILVPAHWPTEISNGMLMAVRRGRLQADRPVLFWEQLAVLPIDVKPALSPGQAKDVLRLCEKHGLTVYDGGYLELAKRKGLALATLDDALIRVTALEGVELLHPTVATQG